MERAMLLALNDEEVNGTTLTALPITLYSARYSYTEE